VLVLQNVCRTIVFLFFMFAAPLQCNLALEWWNGTSIVPPLVMGMQTGSTNNHISQIFFALTAPIYSNGSIG
jgi:hypothetical protein